MARGGEGVRWGAGWTSVSRLGFASLMLVAHIANAMDNADPLLWMTQIEQLEIRAPASDQSQLLEAQFWAGYDLEKFLLKLDAERDDGKTEELEVQALYSRAIAPFWDIQFGLRRDFRPQPKAEWGVIGLQGMAPYFFEVDAAVFVGSAGRTALRLRAEYELLLTQRLILSPEAEINAYGRSDQQRGIGAGFSDAEFGLRLRYEIRREFAPYIGIQWQSKFGQTADYATANGEDRNATQVLIGLRAWF